MTKSHSLKTVYADAPYTGPKPVICTKCLSVFGLCVQIIGLSTEKEQPAGAGSMQTVLGDPYRVQYQKPQ